MSLRHKLTFIVLVLTVAGIGIAVGSTFGAIQDFSRDEYVDGLAEISGEAVALHADEAADLRQRTALSAVVASLIAAGTVVVLGTLAIRRSLRPLERIAATASAINAGALHHRMPSARARNEVGELATALNRMLDELETAFADRAAAQNRLRSFVADASHELRTPVATIRGYAELYRRGAAERPHDLAKVLGRIEQEARRMGVLVEDLLFLARLDESREMVRSPVDLSTLAAEAVDAARSREPSRRWELISEGPSVVDGDADQLRRVLDNLLSNVERHTPQEAAATTVVRAGHGLATVEVRDTGPGIDTKNRQRVLERFYRDDAARSRTDEGHGLGLSIVERIVTLHGGSVTVDSVPGESTTFRVEIPTHDQQPR